MRRPLLSFMLLLCVAYAASTSAYGSEAASYWSEQAMQAPDTAPPAALCISALALAATLVLRRAAASLQRWDQPEFDSETLVLPQRPSR